MKKFMNNIKITEDLQIKAYTPKLNKFLQYVGILSLILLPLFIFTPVKYLFIKEKHVKVQVPVIVRDSFFFVGKDLKQIQPTSHGTIASITNNPGCIMKGNPKIDKYAIGVYQVDIRPFLVFPTASHGWKALDELLSNVYGNRSLIETFTIYCPGTYMGNNAAKYAQTIAKELNTSIHTKIKHIRNRKKLLNAIAEVEGFKKENTEFMNMFVKGSPSNISL
jgi:hypothetical protein